MNRQNSYEQRDVYRFWNRHGKSPWRCEGRHRCMALDRRQAPTTFSSRRQWLERCFHPHRDKHALGWTGTDDRRLRPTISRDGDRTEETGSLFTANAKQMSLIHVACRVRRVELVIEPGQSLGLMIRGGIEYGLGIYVTGVDKESVADHAGLNVSLAFWCCTAWRLQSPPSTGRRPDPRSQRTIIHERHPRRGRESVQISQANVTRGARRGQSSTLVHDHWAGAVGRGPKKVSRLGNGGREGAQPAAATSVLESLVLHKRIWC